MPGHGHIFSPETDKFWNSVPLYKPVQIDSFSRRRKIDFHSNFEKSSFVRDKGSELFRKSLNNSLQIGRKSLRTYETIFLGRLVFTKDRNDLARKRK